MLVETTWEEISKLIAEPQKKPNPEPCEVEIELIGEYLVTGSSGKRYRVMYGIRPDKHLFVACTCAGNLHRKACRHIRATWPIHVEMARLEVDILF